MFRTIALTVSQLLFAASAFAGTGGFVTHTVFHPFGTVDDPKTELNEDDLVPIWAGSGYLSPPQNFEISFPNFDEDKISPPGPKVLTKVRINFSRQRETHWQWEHTSASPVTAHITFEQRLWFTFTSYIPPSGPPVSYLPNGWPYIFLNDDPTSQLDPEFDFPPGAEPIFFSSYSTSDQEPMTQYGAFDGTLDFQGVSAGFGFGYSNDYQPVQIDVTNSAHLRRFRRSGPDGDFHMFLSPRGKETVNWGSGQSPVHWEWSNDGWLRIPAITFTYFWEPAP